MSKLEHVWTNNLPMYYRPNTLDLYVIKEQGSYHRLILKDQIVLDIGSNIGAFHRYAINAGARHVVAIEPDPDNCWLNGLNTHGNVMLIRAAVVSDCYKSEHTELYYNNKKNKGAHSTRPFRGRPHFSVRTIKISEAFKVAPFTVVKCDIEGAEYEVLTGARIPSSIEMMVIEYHFQRRGDTELAHALHDSLIDQRFETMAPVNLDKGCWGTLGFYRREE